MTAGGPAYVMSPEMRKTVEGMRRAAAALEPPGVDDKKQLPKEIKDMLGPFANQLSRCERARVRFRASGFGFTV